MDLGVLDERGELVIEVVEPSWLAGLDFFYSGALGRWSKDLTGNLDHGEGIWRWDYLFLVSIASYICIPSHCRI